MDQQRQPEAKRAQDSPTSARILEHRGFFDSFDFVQQLLGQDLTDAFAASVRNAMRG
jgi:hypothetical protein